MSAPDFDAIAAEISPEQLARAIGAERNGNGSYHCTGENHEHADRNPSLSIDRKDGRTVGCCHACGLKGTPVQIAADVWGLSLGDAAERLVSEIGITVPAKSGGTGLGEIIATYEYVDEDGEHLFEVVRYFPKDFRQRVRQGPGWTWKLGDTRRVIYRLPEVVEAIALGKTIHIVEGEKDADALAERGFVATTCPGGADKFRAEYSESLRGAKVCIIPDNDEQGQKHVQHVAGALQDVASEIRILELPGLPGKGDVSDWLTGGGTDEQLRELVLDAPVWEPPNEGSHVGIPDNGGPAKPGKDDSPHLTDLGNAERFVRHHGKGIRYVREWGTWLVWDDTRWAKDRTGEVERLAQDTIREMHREALEIEDRARAAEMSKHAFRCESEARLRSMVSLARVMDGIPVVPEDLDADPWLFNVENGTIDLRTGKLGEHRQEDRITKLAPVEYDPDATAELFDRFMLEIMDGRSNLVSFLQRFVGYSLPGTAEEHVLLFLYGLGANGKTTLLNVLLHLFGDYGQQSEPQLLLRKRGDTHPTGIADLRGARLVATSEVDEGRHLAESLVKGLTGGDKVKARYMRMDFFEFEPSWTIWLAANHRPVIRGVDVAIWRRIHLVPFDIVIPPDKRDRKLPEKLKAELPGILAWAVRGCLEWQKEGLDAPTEVIAATQSYKDDMDALGAFIDEHCIVEDGAEVEAKDLYEKYKSWTEVSGERKLSQKQLGQRLRDRGFESRKHSRTRRVTYLGIRINTDFEGMRSCKNVSSSKDSHTESNVSSPSQSFAQDKDNDQDETELPF